MNTTDVIKSSLSIYEDKLKKLIEKRDNEIKAKCKELEENLRESLYKKDIKELSINLVIKK